MDGMDLLLRSIQTIDEQIQQLRQQLQEYYSHRQMLVDQLVELAKQSGYHQGYSNGEYRLKRTSTLRVLNKEGILQVAPDIAETKTVIDVDMRKLRALWETDYRNQLSEYVMEEETYEVAKETRKTVKRSLPSE